VFGITYKKTNHVEIPISKLRLELLKSTEESIPIDDNTTITRRLRIKNPMISVARMDVNGVEEKDGSAPLYEGDEYQNASS
jgi:hypothetical protein